MVVLIADDAVFMRMVLKNTLINDCGIDKANIYEAGDCAGALKQYCLAKPEIVFLDVHLAGQNGPEMVRELLSVDPNARIVICAVAGKQVEILECIATGAKGCIKKPPQPERVIEAIEQVTGRKIKGGQTAKAVDAGEAGECSGPGGGPLAQQAMPPKAQAEEPSLQEQILSLRREVSALKEEVVALKHLFEGFNTGGNAEALKRKVVTFGQLFEGPKPR